MLWSAGEPVAGRGLMSGCHAAQRNDWTEREARRVRGTRGTLCLATGVRARRIEAWHLTAGVSGSCIVFYA